MPLIRKPLVWTRQPQHAAGVNKRFAPNFLITAGSGLREAVTGAIGSLSSASIAPAAAGKSLLLDGASGFGQFASHPCYDITGALTLVWAGTLTDHANYNMLVTRSAGNGATNNPFEFRCDSGTGYLTLTRANASYSQFASSVGAPTGKRCVLIVTHGDNMLNSGGLSFYIDGVAVSGSLTNSNAVIGQASGNSEPLFVGKRADGHFHKGSTELVAGFSRVISSAEARQISENVNLLFAPTSRTIFIPSAGGTTSLVLQNSSHGHAADNIALNWQALLSVADSIHSHAADNLGLSTQQLLVVAEAAHAHAADNQTLSTQVLLGVSEALHAHSTDGVLLTTQLLLAVNESLHAHAVDVLTLDTSNTTFIVVQDAAHSHATDSVSLTLNTWLTISEAAHAHAAEAPSLSVQVALLVTDSQHAHAADNVVLDASNAVFLVVQEAGNAHTADGVALTTQQLLSVSEALHGHVADQLQLDPGQHVLVIADARHLHFADQLFFSLEGVFRGLRIHVLTKRDRRFVLRKDPLIHVSTKNKRLVTTTH